MRSNEKTNIAFVTANLSLIGPGIILRSLIKNLDKEKYNLFVFSIIKIPKSMRHSSIREDLLKEGTTIIEFNFPKPLDLCSVINLWHYFKKYKIDIVHTHLVRAHIYGRISARLARVPVIVSTVHNMDHWKKNKNPFHKLASLIDKITASYADKIVTVSNAVGDYIREWQKIQVEKTVTIYNGIDLEKFGLQNDRSQISQELHLAVNGTIVTFIGRLDIQKGCEYLLRAAAESLQEEKNIQFLIVGEGRLKEELLSLTSKLGIDKETIFTGFREDIQNILTHTDIFVMPSLWEGFGLSLVEAMAAGKPVIATNVGPLPELINHEETGFIVPARNHRALSVAILTLVKNKELREKMGKKAQDRVREKFDSLRMAQNYDKLYVSLLKNKREID